jgi:hypothetical protein
MLCARYLNPDHVGDGRSFCPTSKLRVFDSMSGGPAFWTSTQGIAANHAKSPRSAAPLSTKRTNGHSGIPPALNSRCILVPMFENKSTILAPTEDRGIRSLAADLQAQLLRFRLEKFKTVQSVAVSGDEVLRPRTRDLLRSLTAATVEDSPRSQRLLEFFESGQALPSEPLSPEQNAVLHLLFSIVHSGESYSSVWVSELTKQLNSYL